MEAIVIRVIKRTLLWSAAVLATVALALGALITWPDPLFAYSRDFGRIVIASDRPIPPVGGERLVHDCERLLDRSPLRATSAKYRLYVTNDAWRHRLLFIPRPDAWGYAWYYGLGGHAVLSAADFERGRVVHRGYVGTPPRTLAWLCAHELTHIIASEHVGFAHFRVPQWVWEGFPDYVGIDKRETFDELRAALGDRPVDDAMRVAYGGYPRYRLLVTYFLERKGWSVDRLLATRLTEAEATALMRADTRGGMR
jgi:hypothetical protein